MYFKFIILDDGSLDIEQTLDLPISQKVFKINKLNLLIELKDFINQNLIKTSIKDNKEEIKVKLIKMFDLIKVVDIEFYFSQKARIILFIRKNIDNFIENNIGENLFQRLFEEEFNHKFRIFFGI